MTRNGQNTGLLAVDKITGRTSNSAISETNEW